MNKLIPFFALMGLAAMPLAQAHPHDHEHSDTPTCDSLDSRTGSVHFNGDIDLDDDEIVIRNEDNDVVMLITEDRELYYNGEKLPLTDDGQMLVDSYYETFDEAMSEFTGIAGDAAGLGVDAATTVVAALFSGDFDEDEIEARIEAKAAKIEARAEAGCAKLASLEQIELAMAEEIEGFEPVLFDRH